MQDASSLVARLYEAFPYPPPSRDLAKTIADGEFQVGDPSLWAPMLWPEGRPREELDILVAGCGTMQAAWFAFTNRHCNVVGVDLSEESLAHTRFLQEKHDLKNLRLYRGDLREVGEIRTAFDLVICTGVLHHLRDPDEGMRALASVMAPHAALACMVYGATRRVGVYMMQEAFRRMGVEANAEGVAFARRVLGSLPDWHYVHWYLRRAPELQHDEALADTFLHPQDRAYTVPELLALAEENGLHFQGWFENSVYYPEGSPWLMPELAAKLGALPPRDQWIAMEMLSPASSTHYFFARKSPPPSLSFHLPDALIPQRHPGVRRTSASQLARMGRPLLLSADEMKLFEGMDGRRTVAELGGGVELFERLWRQGHVMMSTR
jgi:SAM-dependent methyltransferase